MFLDRSKQTATILVFLLFSSGVLAAPLKVVTTLPDLAEIARRIGGSEVSAESLLSGREDAHFADAVPNYIRKVADADVVCQMGLELEVGWMPKVLSKSGNAKVQAGGKGYCDVGSGVEVLEKPQGVVDRAMGDVHPSGNPHFNLSPKALKEAASVLTRVLIANRPEQKAVFDSGLQKFQVDMDLLQKRISEKLKPVLATADSKPLVIEYHKEFTYFFALYGVKSVGAIEEKPGVPPSAARIASVATMAKAQEVKVALAANYSPTRTLERFQEISKIPFRQVPVAVQVRGEVNSIEKLQESIADAIISSF